MAERPARLALRVAVFQVREARAKLQPVGLRWVRIRCWGRLAANVAYVGKEECTKERLLSLIEKSGFDFEIEEYDNFYKVV